MDLSIDFKGIHMYRRGVGPPPTQGPSLHTLSPRVNTAHDINYTTYTSVCEKRTLGSKH
jgi:hypothetical protein